MKQQNPYATNKGGLIRSPKKPATGDPRATTIVKNGGGDLRTGK